MYVQYRGFSLHLPLTSILTIRLGNCNGWIKMPLPPSAGVYAGSSVLKMAIGSSNCDFFLIMAYYLCHMEFWRALFYLFFWIKHNSKERHVLELPEASFYFEILSHILLCFEGSSWTSFLSLVMWHQAWWHPTPVQRVSRSRARRGSMRKVACPQWSCAKKCSKVSRARPRQPEEFIFTWPFSKLVSLFMFSWPFFPRWECTGITTDNCGHQSPYFTDTG